MLNNPPTSNHDDPNDIDHLAGQFTSSMTLNNTPPEDQEIDRHITSLLPLTEKSPDLIYPTLPPFSKVFAKLQNHGYPTPKLEKLKSEVNKMLMKPGRFEENMKMYLTCKRAWEFALRLSLGEDPDISAKFGLIAYQALNPPAEADRLTDGNNNYIFTFMLPNCVKTAWTADIPPELRNEATLAIATTSENQMTARMANSDCHSVQDVLGEGICQFFKDWDYLVDYQYGNFNNSVKSDFGKPIVTVELSKKAQKVGVAMFLVDHDATTPWGAFRKGFKCACKLLCNQLTRGVQQHDACAAIISTTGCQHLFAFVTMMDDTVSILHIVSDEISGSSLHELVESFAHIKLFCEGQSELICRLPKPTIAPKAPAIPTLNRDLFEIKSIKDIVRRFGGNKPIEMNFFHMWRVFQRLQDIQEVVKPFGIVKLAATDEPPNNLVLELISCPGTPLDLVATDQPNEAAILFPRLHEDYVNGIPTDANDRREFINKVKSTLQSCHEKGVVHMFLNPSNISWRKTTNGNVEIRITDWDSTTIIGEGFPDGLLKRMTNTGHMGYYMDPDFIARDTCDAWFVYTLELLAQKDVDDMAKQEPGEMNWIFRDALYKYSADAYGCLGDNFKNSWLKNHWISQQ
ncbi:hypothetical protein HDU76_000006 [Blyttiomyces sp. JEL0837]|nr:hypothetical protein HDU76_000006 [Blyttiomyces sp. JEL0837]